LTAYKKKLGETYNKSFDIKKLQQLICLESAKKAMGNNEAAPYLVVEILMVNGRRN